MSLSQKEIERRVQESQRRVDLQRTKRQRRIDFGLWLLVFGLIAVFVAMGINVANHV